MKKFWLAKVMITLSWFSGFVLGGFLLCAPAQATIKEVATYIARGLVRAQCVGPGPTTGSERFYLCYNNFEGALEVVSINPDDGSVMTYVSPLASETGAYGLCAGDNQAIYLGTVLGAYILKLNPQTGTFVSLGQPCGTETYIWNMVKGADGKIYGGTYPGARLIRVDPATDIPEDLGCMDTTEQYVRFVAADNNGFVYCATGPINPKIVAYQISTQTPQIIFSGSGSLGFINLTRGTDAQVYAQNGPLWYLLSGFNTPTPASAPTPVPNNKFSDGRTIQVDSVAAGGFVTVTDSDGITKHQYPFNYAGQPQHIFRFCYGPGDLIYGSGYVPLNLFKLNPMNESINILGFLGNGEANSLCPWQGKLFLGSYYGYSPLMSYDPSLSFSPGSIAGSNPLITQQPIPTDWRPFAMIANPNDGKLYIGARPGYGVFGGPLVSWDGGSNITSDVPISDESLYSLVLWNNKIICGTSVLNGVGTTPTHGNPSLFIWDPVARCILPGSLVKVTQPGDPANVGDTIWAMQLANNGKVYGFCGTSFSSRLFVFDPTTYGVTYPAHSPINCIYNSLANGVDGNIWGISTSGVFKINIANDTIVPIESAPEAVTSGFAMRGNQIYFGCGGKIYSYSPAPAGWWKLDESTGSIAPDSSGNGHNGTLYGPNGLPTWANGKAGGALNFDGVDDYVTVSNVGVDTTPGGCNTVAFWMKWDGVAIKMPFAWNVAYYDLFFSNGCFGINTGGNLLGIPFSSANYANKWVHVAVVFPNAVLTTSNAKIFINGTQQTLTWCVGGPGSSKSATSTFYLAKGPVPGYQFGGSIDDLQIYNRELTAAEVAALAAIGGE